MGKYDVLATICLKLKNIIHEDLFAVTDEKEEKIIEKGFEATGKYNYHVLEYIPLATVPLQFIVIHI